MTRMEQVQGQWGEWAVSPELAPAARWLSWMLLPTMTIALGAIFLYAPTERIQGVVQRIFYFHVPLAWVSYLAFFVVFVCGSVYLWRRDWRWDRWARCSAEVGVVFATLFIVTGSLWAKPIWGTWWTWDARLTSSFILWLIYVGYLMLRSYVSDQGQGARFGAVLGIIGFLDVPIVQLSVTWWRTLHPDPTIVQESGKVGIPPEMVLTLVLSLAAVTLLYMYLLVQRVRLEELRDAVIQLSGVLLERGR